MKDQIINKILRIVKDFNNSTVSIHDLLEQTKYSKHANQISEHDLYTKLKASPGIVNDWFSYSEDKRTDRGWYIKQINKNTFIVGFLDETGKKEFKYRDKLKACAKFIKHEIDMILSV